jgi:hypothetical protein
MQTDWILNLQKARDRVGSKRVEQSKPVIINALTDAATSLMTEDADAFELTREEIAHALQISQITAPRTDSPGLRLHFSVHSLFCAVWW